MDIYEYLKLDHAKVDNLFKLFEASTHPKRQHEIATLITQELLVHAHAEQETFYKYLAQFPETEDLSKHGEEEHQEIETQINLILHAKKEDKAWQDAVLKLKEIVTHHVKEEEGEMFAAAKTVIDDKQALILKEKMHYLKGKFLIWLESQALKDSKPEKKAAAPKTKTMPPKNHAKTQAKHPPHH